MDGFDGNGRSARLLRDEPVLFFDEGARGGIAIEAAEELARHSAIGPLRTVFVNHVEKSEFNPCCRLPCHFDFLPLSEEYAAGGIAITQGREQSAGCSGIQAAGPDASFLEEDWIF